MEMKEIRRIACKLVGVGRQHGTFPLREPRTEKDDVLFPRILRLETWVTTGLK